MTGPEHYQEAEKKLQIAENMEPGSDNERYNLAAAQVHAALAQAAASAPSEFADAERSWRYIAH